MLPQSGAARTWRYAAFRRRASSVARGAEIDQQREVPLSILEKRDGDRATVIGLYRLWLMKQPELVRAAREELAGKTLGCWCAPLPCHGDVLVEIANDGMVTVEGGQLEMAPAELDEEPAWEDEEAMEAAAREERGRAAELEPENPSFPRLNPLRPMARWNPR